MNKIKAKLLGPFIISIVALLNSACGERGVCTDTLLTEVGCKQLETTFRGINADHKIDDSLKPLFDQFKNDSNSFGVQIPEDRELYNLSFSQDLRSGKAGLCRKETVRSIENNLLETRVLIYLNPSIRDRPLALKKVVYHEFGHCFFDLAHEEKKVSLMNRRAPASSSWDELLVGFFDSI